MSTLGKIVKKGYEELLQKKISDSESTTLVIKISRDNFRRKAECEKKKVECKRVILTKEYLESLLREEE